MNFEPQKFFIGLVDFFSVLMPGAILAYVVKDWGASTFLGKDGFPLAGTENIVMFFFVSYLLGHFAFLLSALLDKWVYGPVRGWTDWGQISERLGKGKSPSAPWQRRFAASGLLFGKDADNAVMQAQRIKARALHGLEADDAINAFQWCKTRLTKELPEGLLAVQRFEAVSKFFRSLFVVLAALVVVYAAQRRWLEDALCVAGMLLALWRYIDQRFKVTQHAYWFVIMLEARKAKVRAAAPPRQDGLSLAGGVVYRRAVVKNVEDGSEKEINEFMLVQASKQHSDWVLPKGHIEAGEEPRITAVREVREETGHWAKVENWLDDGPLNKNAADSPLVRWFLLKSCEEPKDWPRECRQYDWLPLAAAIDKAEFEETRTLLQLADEEIELALADPAKS